MRTLVMPNQDMAKNAMSPLVIDAERFPIATYSSRFIEYYGTNRFKVHGDLTFRDVTKSIDADVQFNGFAYADLHGMPGFTVTAKFNRFDFEVNHQNTLTDEVPLIGDTIYITASLRFYADL